MSTAATPALRCSSPATMGLDNVATLLPATICTRSECRQPFTPRRGGKPQKYCSARCRWLAWSAAHPRHRDATSVDIKRSAGLDAHPAALDRAALAAASGYGHVNSTGFVKALGRLRSLGLLDYPEPGKVVATDVLFLDQ